jgi:hypothetical protein
MDFLVRPLTLLGIEFQPWMAIVVGALAVYIFIFG